MSMPDETFWRWSARAIADAVNSGNCHAREVMDDVIARAVAVEPSLNAFALLDCEAACAAADDLDRRIAAGETPGPLAGVPFSVKDLVATRGMETAYGSHIFAGHVPQEDAEAVARLRRAGAILIGKTNTPEFGHKALTNNPRHGYTRNPWDRERSPGGSSGGAAAAVAAGMGPIALNTDGAGSARIPASACGVLGLKPTMGLVPNETAIELFSTFINLGLNARNADDLAVGLTAIAGPCADDPWTMNAPARDYRPSREPLAGLDGLRILVFKRMGNRLLDRDVERLLDGALQSLASAGARIEEGPEDFDWAKPTAFAAMRAYQRARLERYCEEWQDRMDPSLVRALEQGRQQDLLALQSVPAERSELFRRVQSLFDSHDLIVTPTVSAPPPGYDHDQDEPMHINGELAGPLRANWYGYTGVSNMTGHPAISIPMGFTSDGLPAGFHAVGRWLDEPRLIDLAAAFESIQPWADRWPDL